MVYRYTKTRMAFLSVLFSLLGILFHSHAGLEGNEIPISIKEYDQQNPHLVYLPDKNLWFTVWEDYRNQNNSGSDIYGAFIKNDGTVCGTDIQITNSNGNETYPSVAYNQNGQIVVAWQDTRSNYVYYKDIDISALNITDCSGYTLGAEQAVGFTSIAGDTLVARQKPKIKYDPVNDRYFIVYVETRSTPNLVEANCFNLGLHRYSLGDTTFVGYTILDNTLTSSSTDIIRNNIGSSNLKSRLIESSKGSLTERYTYEYFTRVDNPTIGIDTTSNNQFMVFEGVEHIAEITCTCEDNNNNICDTGDIITSTLRIISSADTNRIYGIWYSEIPLGSIYHTSIDEYLYQDYVGRSIIPPPPSYSPNIAFDKITKRFLVVWENAGETGNTKVYGQLVSSGVGLYNQHILISYQDIDGDGEIDPNVANSNQSKPYVDYDPVNQRFFVIWQDGRNGTVSLENLDIYGQYVDSEGSLRGNNYIINTEPFNQRDPVVAFNNNLQQYLAVWKDARNSNEYTCGITGDKPCGSDIYGQRFTIGQPQITLLSQENTVLSPSLIDFGEVYTSGSQEYTFSIKNTGDAVLEIDCIREKNTSLIPQVYEIVSLPDELKVCGDNNVLTLLPNTSTALTVVFHPTGADTYQMTLEILSNASQSVEVYVQGKGIATGGNLIADKTAINFNSVVINTTATQKVVLTNSGNGDITINQILNIPQGYTISLESVWVVWR